MDRSSLNAIMDFINQWLEADGNEACCIETGWDAREEVLVLYIDKKDYDPLVNDSSLVDVNFCERVHRKIAKDDKVYEKLLSIIGKDFALEVSSPGINRPLRKVEDIRRCVGKSVIVKTSKGKKEQGSIKEVEGNSIVVLVEDGSSKKFDIDDLVYIHLIQEVLD